MGAEVEAIGAGGVELGPGRTAGETAEGSGLGLGFEGEGKADWEGVAGEAGARGGTGVEGAEMLAMSTISSSNLFRLIARELRRFVESSPAAGVAEADPDVEGLGAAAVLDTLGAGAESSASFSGERRPMERWRSRRWSLGAEDVPEVSWKGLPASSVSEGASGADLSWLRDILIFPHFFVCVLSRLLESCGT